MNYVFVYGTLQREDVQLSVLGRKLDTVSDKLRDYKQDEVIINGNKYPIAVNSKRSLVEGSIIEVTDEELQKLDKYETPAYERVKVISDSGRQAFVYRKPWLTNS